MMPDPAFQHRQQQVVLPGEIAVERLLRRARLGDDVTDPRRLGSDPFHHPHGRGKDPLHLLAGLAVPVVEGTLDGCVGAGAHDRGSAGIRSTRSPYFALAAAIRISENSLGHSGSSAS